MFLTYGACLEFICYTYKVFLYKHKYTRHFYIFVEIIVDMICMPFMFARNNHTAVVNCLLSLIILFW